MVSVSASVNLPLHHENQKFSSGTGSPGWSRKKGRKTVVVWWFKKITIWDEQHRSFYGPDVLPVIRQTVSAY